MRCEQRNEEANITQQILWALPMHDIILKTVVKQVHLKTSYKKTNAESGFHHLLWFLL